MKPLKILLGNNTLSLLAGSETWTYTLAIQLKSMGHDVSCYAPKLGIISEQLITAGIPCYDDFHVSKIKPFSYVLEEKVDHNYDVIISNHHHIVEYLREKFPSKPIISTIHGIIHFDGKEKAPEHPALNSGVGQFVAVSEEIQEKLLNDYGLDSIIIRNFFDIKKLSSIPPTPVLPYGKFRQFLVNTNYSDRNDPVLTVVREVAKHFGAKVAAVGQNFNQSFDLTKAITDSDIVFGMGRSVLEGVAAGRFGIVHGRWGTGGVVCENNLDDVRRYNFSGRNRTDKKIATAQEIIGMIDLYYKRPTLEWGMQYAAREHNVVFAAERYVQIARDLTGQTINENVNSAVDPAAKKFRLAKDVQ